jgi:hypothetical protein
MGNAILRLSIHRQSRIQRRSWADLDLRNEVSRGVLKFANIKKPMLNNISAKDFLEIGRPIKMQIYVVGPKGGLAPSGTRWTEKGRPVHIYAMTERSKRR